MTLGVKNPALQPTILALTHDSLHVLLEHLQVAEHNPFELAAALRIGRNLLHLGQGHRDVALEDLLPEGGRPAEAPVSQLLNLAPAQILAAQRQNELFALLRADAVHAHELAHDPHVGIDREGSAEELFPHLGADLPQQTQPHTHPGFADREVGGNLRHTPVPHVLEFVQEPSLLEEVEALVLGPAQQPHDPAHFVGADHGIGHRVQMQLASTAIALEAIEQNRGGLAPSRSGGLIDAFQRFLDAALGHRGQKPGFDRRPFEAVVLISQVQRGQFNLARHTGLLQGGCSLSQATV